MHVVSNAHLYRYQRQWSQSGHCYGSCLQWGLQLYLAVPSLMCFMMSYDCSCGGSDDAAGGDSAGRCRGRYVAILILIFLYACTCRITMYVWSCEAHQMPIGRQTQHFAPGPQTNLNMIPKETVGTHHIIHITVIYNSNCALAMLFIDVSWRDSLQTIW